MTTPNDPKARTRKTTTTTKKTTSRKPPVRKPPTKTPARKAPTRKPSPVKAEQAKSRIDFSRFTVPWLFRRVSTIAALGLSGWSIFVLMHDHLDVPFPLAILTSSIFDGAALVAADLVQKYSRTVDSGFLARIWMYFLIGASMWLNNLHGEVSHYDIGMRVAIVLAPLVPAIEFELTNRFEHRQEMRKAGRVAKALPPFGLWVWLRPFKTLKRIYAMAEYRRQSIPLDYMVWMVDGVPQPRTTLPLPTPELEPEPTGPKPARRRESATRRDSASEQARQDATVAPNVAPSRAIVPAQARQNEKRDNGRDNGRDNVSPNSIAFRVEQAKSATDAVAAFDAATTLSSGATVAATKVSEFLSEHGWNVSAATVRKYRSRISDVNATAQRNTIHVIHDEGQDAQ